MNKNVSISLAAGVTVLGGFLMATKTVYAEIPGKYLSADLGAADLMGIASKYPILFWTALIVLVIVCLGYGIYYLLKKKPN